MKIIAWNCNMAFRDKAATILKHKPDILVVPECECPDKLLFPPRLKKPTSMLWFGKNLHKGMGVFAYNGYKLATLDVHNDAYKMIAPIAVTGGRLDFTLFAVWAYNPTDKDGFYVTQVWKAIHCYDMLLDDKHVVLAGDFNSNTIWDRPRRNGNHTHVVQKLAEKGIASAYHKHFNQQQGKEKHPTQYMYRHKNKPYHLDYCFASAGMLQHLESVKVGTHARWHKYSDHVPVIVSFGSGLYAK